MPPEPPPIVEEDDSGELPEIHGFPSWIKLSGLAIGVLMILSLVRVPETIKWAVKVERGQRYLHGGDYKRAADELAPVLAKFPANLDLNLDLAEAQYQDGQIDAAYTTMDRLVGKEVDERQGERADRLDRQIQAALERESTEFEQGLDLAEKQLNAGQTHEAAATLDHLRGKMAEDKQYERADKLADQVDAALDREKAKQASQQKAEK